MAEKKKKFKLIFVCSGNTCRSPMAEFLFKAYLKERKITDVDVSSAGLYAARGDVLSENADRALAFLNVPHTARKAKMFTAQMALDADMVIAMTDAHADACGELERLYTFEDFGALRGIGDPYGGTLQDYLDCAAKMRACFDEILAEINAIKQQDMR